MIDFIRKLIYIDPTTKFIFDGGLCEQIRREQRRLVKSVLIWAAIGLACTVGLCWVNTAKAECITDLDCGMPNRWNCINVNGEGVCVFMGDFNEDETNDEGEYYE